MCSLLGLILGEWAVDVGKSRVVVAGLLGSPIELVWRVESLGWRVTLALEHSLAEVA